MSRDSIRLRFWIISTFGLCTILLFARLLKMGISPPQSIYYLALIMIILPYIFHLESLNKNEMILGLIFLSAAINFLYPIMSPNGIPYNIDSLYLTQTTQLFSKSGHWMIDSGTQLARAYSNYPSVSIYNIFFKEITGIPILFLISWSLTLIRFLVIPLCLFEILRYFFEKSTAFLGVVIYLTSPSSMVFPHHENLALVFFVMFLFFTLKSEENGGKTSMKYIFLSMLMIVLIVFTHHFSSFILLIWILGVYVLRMGAKSSSLINRKFFVDNKIYKFSFISILLVITLFLSFHLWINIKMYLNISTVLSNFVRSIFDFSSEALFKQSQFEHYYNIYERSILYFSMLIISISSFLGFFKYLKRRVFDIVVMNFILSLTITGISIFAFFFTPYSWIIERIFEFSYIGFAPMAAFWFSKMNKYKLRKMVVPILISILLIGGNLKLVGNPKMYYFEIQETENNRRKSEVYSMKAYHSTQFLKNINIDSQVMGDYYVINLYGGLGHLKTPLDIFPPSGYVYKFFIKEYISQEDVIILYKRNVGYVVIHKFMSFKTYINISNNLNLHGNFDRIFDDGEFIVYKLISTI